MDASSRQLRITAHRCCTAFLAVWITGIAFIFCCPARATNAQTQACPLATRDDCKGSRKSAGKVLTRSEASTAACCTFLSAVFDKARKIEKLDRFPTIYPFTTPFTRLAQGPFQVFSRATTYVSPACSGQPVFVRNCVFRI